MSHLSGCLEPKKSKHLLEIIAVLPNDVEWSEHERHNLCCVYICDVSNEQYNNIRIFQIRQLEICRVSGGGGQTAVQNLKVSWTTVQLCNHWSLGRWVAVVKNLKHNCSLETPRTRGGVGTAVQNLNVRSTAVQLLTSLGGGGSYCSQETEVHKLQSKFWLQSLHPLLESQVGLQRQKQNCTSLCHGKNFRAWVGH